MASYASRVAMKVAIISSGDYCGKDLYVPAENGLMRVSLGGHCLRVWLCDIR